jgi:hypothetical protein
MEKPVSTIQMATGLKKHVQLATEPKKRMTTTLVLGTIVAVIVHLAKVLNPTLPSLPYNSRLFIISLSLAIAFPGSAAHGIFWTRILHFQYLRITPESIIRERMPQRHQLVGKLKMLPVNPFYVSNQFV